MKQIFIRIVVAMLAFVFGVVTSAIVSKLSESPISFPLLTSRDEGWHRLYEAAEMSGDSTFRNEVHDRLLCANSAGVPDALRVEMEGTVWCQRADGSIHQLRLVDTSEYGSYSWRISSSHRSWTLENLDFLRTINTAQKAKEYVETHEWPSNK